MKIGRCPTCHSHISIEAIAQDESAKELLLLLASMDGDLSRPLAAYLGLFRPEKRDLTFDRALKLAREVCGLAEDRQRLAIALASTVDSIRSKGGGPVKNHNYLKRVLEGISSQQKIVEAPKGARIAGKTEQAFVDLENMKQ